MHQLLLHYALLLATLSSFLPLANGFLNLDKSVGRSLGFDGSWSYAPLISRADDDPPDEEDSSQSGLGPCLSRCGGTKPLSPPGSPQLLKREVCGGSREPSRCLSAPDNSSELWDRSLLHKRAPPPFPTGDNDLRRKTQEQLNDWIVQRVNYGNDVKLLWEDVPKQYIELTMLNEGTNFFPIPTSFFQDPGNEPFAWGTIGLVGCTLMTIVKAPTVEDPAKGVYMGHYWEAPGWDTVDDDDGNILMNAKPGAYIYNFLRRGFPHPGIPGWPKEADRNPEYANPTPQTSLTAIRDHFKGAFALVMHPRKTVEDPPDSNRYRLEEGPEFGDKLKKMKDTCQDIMGKVESKLNFNQDYLYVPDRRYERYQTQKDGRTIFEYQPNFNGRKTGVLLYEDGGEQPTKTNPDGTVVPDTNEDGTFKPGPGGPFFFDFGPADEDTEMTDADK